MTRRLWLLCALAVLLPTVGHAQPCSGTRPHDICEAAPAGSSTEAASQATTPGKPAGASAKVSAPIRAVLSSMRQRTLGAEGQTFVARYSTNLVRVNPAGEIQVYVELVDFQPEYVTRLEGHGLRVEVALPQFRLVQGWLPAAAVQAVASLAFVKEVRQPDYGVRNSVGAASTAGDNILRADVARSLFGVSGAGVKIGVISDGVDFLVDSQNSGDLPFVEVFATAGGNEGTAMLEIVHDLAPGAALAFWGPATSVEMVQGINLLRDVGARVVVDDLSFFFEPKFEDGAIAQTAEAFAQNGRAYVSSAGNHAEKHYRAVYARLTGQEFPSSAYPGVHNYAAGGIDIGNTLTVPDGCSLSVVLQWSNPWGASADDFDLYIVRAGDFAVLGASEGPQTGTQNPIEFAGWTNNTGGVVTVFIAIAEFSLVNFPGSLVLDYFLRTGCAGPLQYVTLFQSLVGNNAAPGIFSVAAVNAETPTVAEPFSSWGPHDIFFPAFERRGVPNITAVDAVQTRTGQRGHFSNPFFGTSAAAPHVAAVAALLAEASPALDSRQIQTLLINAALDLGPAGFDIVYGGGLVDAVNAINFSPFPPFAFIESNGTSFKAGQTVTLNLTAANPPGNLPLDLYVGALWPDGNTIAFITGPDVFGGLGQFNAPASVAPMTTMTPGSVIDGQHLLTFTLPAEGIPAGTYYVFAALFRQGTLADNNLDNGDMVRLSYFPVAYAP